MGFVWVAMVIGRLGRTLPESMTARENQNEGVPRMAPYEIYALKYAGPVTSSGAFIMWMQDWDAVIERNYYLWCIKGPHTSIVVDTGISPAMARQRNLPGYVSPTELLPRIGIDADRVEHVIVTHIHWDHA